MLTTIDHIIIAHLARTLWLSIYADATERGDTARILAERAGYSLVNPEGGTLYFRREGVSQCEEWTENVLYETEQEAWEGACDNAGINVDRAGAGQDWADHSPPTPEGVLPLAYYLAGQISIINRKTLFFLAMDAAEADGLDRENIEDLMGRRASYLEEFGSDLAMMCIGSGVGWFDNHEKFPLEVPHLETPCLEDVGWPSPENNKLTLPSGSSARGAQMGRPDQLPDDVHAAIRLRVEKLTLEDGDYDQWGAYWGFTKGSPIYCAWTNEPEEVRLFIRAAHDIAAKEAVRHVLPNATFHH